MVVNANKLTSTPSKQDQRLTALVPVLGGCVSLFIYLTNENKMLLESKEGISFR